MKEKKLANLLLSDVKKSKLVAMTKSDEYFTK